MFVPYKDLSCLHLHNDRWLLATTTATCNVLLYMGNSWYATAIHKQLGKTATEWKKKRTCKLGIVEQSTAMNLLFNVIFL